MTEQKIELCLERFATCKATDVMNFDYAGTLAYIERLKAENAALRERLGKAVELPCQIGDTLYGVYNDKVAEYIVIGLNVLADWTLEIYLKTQNKRQNRFSTFSTSIGVRYFKDREAAEARLAELNGGKNE